MMTGEYNGGLTREKFLFFEIREVAKLICEGLDKDAVLGKIKAENLFQFPTERMISSIALTCFKRIDALDSEALVYHLATHDFPDYSREELGDIAKAFLAKKKYEIEDDALARLLDVTEYYRNLPNFANARTIRNIIDQVLMNQNLRTEDCEADNTVIIDDVEDYLADEENDLARPGKGKGHIGFV